MHSVLFQLTSSRRGWLGGYFNTVAGWIFQLTSSRRGWPSEKSHFWCPHYFNSHPHEEDDGKNLDHRLLMEYFNSHPHEEDDFKTHTGCNKRAISTHILTKRMTGCELWRDGKKYISTHILTKRMTILTWYVCYCICISTHILTKRMTAMVLKNLITRTFQLTSSRRGWRKQCSCRPVKK